MTKAVRIRNNEQFQACTGSRCNGNDVRNGLLVCVGGIGTMNTPYYDNELDRSSRNGASYNRYRQAVREDEDKANWYDDLMVTLAWCSLMAVIYFILTGVI